MNKIYKVIWNRVRHCYVVVSEIAKNHGKEHSTNLRVSKGLCALTLAIGLSLSSYAFAANPVDLGNSGSAAYDANGNLTIGNTGTVAQGDNKAGKNNTTIGNDTDTLRNVKDGNTTKKGQPMDEDNKKLIDNGKAVELQTSTESGGSTAVGYNNKAEGDNSTAIGNTAKIINKPITYYADKDGNKTTSTDDAVWYKDSSGNPTEVPQVFRDADGNTTTTPQYVHTYTEKDPTTGEEVTKTEITSDVTKADQKDGKPVYNYQKSDNLDKLYSVTLYQAASNSIAAGSSVTANGNNAVAVGYNSTADNSAVAVGDTAVASENAVAIGKNTNASVEGSIALGKDSEADRSGGTTGWDPKTGTTSTQSGLVWKSTEGALSVGSGSVSRQITGVAAGSEDTDAVNLAQLKKAMTHYYSVKTTAETDGKGNNNYLNDGATGDNALAAGVSAVAQGNNATAVGTSANATASQATAIGNSASATSSQSTAIGNSAGAHGDYATALGNSANASSTYATAIGASTIAPYSQSTAVGASANATATQATAMGSSASATSSQSTAVGYNAGAHEDYATAIGSSASATSSKSTAIGNNAGAHGESATALGNGASATNKQATAIGSGAAASGADAIAMGNGSSSTDSSTIAIGSGAGAHGSYAIALGNGSSAANSYSIAIGASALAPYYQATALGNGANATNSQATAIGSSSAARGTYATALGNGASAYSSYATALGSSATAQSSDDTAIGSSAKASGGDATALGYNAQATAPNATALGSGASASQSYALAAGDGANAQGYQTIALGNNAQSNAEGGVALGSGSTANVTSGKTGLDPHTGAASTATGPIWVSTLGAVSVGTVDSDGQATGTRQINGVAAGTQDTDAVNVAQLKAMETRINMHYYSVNSTLSGDGSNYDNTGASGTNAMAAGPAASASGDSSVAIGNGAVAEGKGATVIGKNARAAGQYATAFGGLETTDKQTGKIVNIVNTASGNSATAFGQGAQARGDASLAFGHNTIAGGADGGGQQSVAFGEDTQALGGRSLAFGEKTIAKYNDSVAFGNDTRASSTGSTAFGNRTRALAQYSTAWGNATVAADEESTAWGTDTIAGAKLDDNGAVTNKYKENGTDKTEQMDVHGNLAYIQNGKTAGIKQMPIDSGTERHDYVVLDGKDGNTYVRDYQGSLWKVNVDANGNVTVDETVGQKGKVFNGKNGAKQSLAKTTVNGAEVDITPDNVLTKAHEGTNGYNIDGYANATAFGYSTEASGDNATAFGNDTKATAAGATAFGYKTLASGENSTAFGENSVAAAKNSLAALGGTVDETAANAAAIGSGAQARLADSIALGSGALANRSSGSIGYDVLTGKASGNTSAAWVSSASAIAVGNDNDTEGSLLTRQITGVAAGSLDTDAVNVAQLKAAGLSFTTNTKDASNTTDNYKGYKVVGRRLGDTIAIKAGDEADNHSYSTSNLTTRIAENGDISILMDENPTFTSVTTGDVIFAGNPNLTDKDGKAAKADTNAAYGTKTLTDSQNITSAGNDTQATRLHYKDDQGHTYELATMDDGQIYAGDIKTDGTPDSTGFARTMNQKTTINGGVTNISSLTDNNIGVVSNGTDTLTVKLAKDLKDLNSVTTGKTVQNDSGIKITNDSTDDSKNVVINGDQISFGGNQVNNMGSGINSTTNQYDTPSNGANIGDVKNIANTTVQPVIDTVNKGWELDVNDTKQKAVTPTNPKVNLIQGQNITITGDTTNTDNVTIATANDVRFNTVRVGGVKTDTGYTGGIVIGKQSGGDSANPDENDYITGLKNINWDSNKIQSGRAATEDQLQAVATEIKNGTVKGDVYVTGGAVSYKGEGADADPKDGTGSINLTRQNGTDVHIGGLHDYYITDGTVTNDGKTLELTRNDVDGDGNHQKITVDLGNVLKNDQHLVTNPDAADGKYKVNTTDGTVTLKVKNGDTYDDITIGGFEGLGRGLQFGANQKVAENGSNPVTNQLGSIINITGAGAKALNQYSGKNLITSVEQDADGNTTIHVLMDKNISADGVTVGQAGKDGVAGADGEIGQAGTIGINGRNGVKGEDGKEGITTTIIRTEKGQPGADGINGKPGVDGTDITRIVYQNGQDGTDGKDTHTVATLDDGLKFAGDDGQNDDTKVINKKLNERLDIVGKAQGDLTDANIGVTKDENGKLYIQLAKHVNLDGDGTLQAGDAKIGHFTNTELTTNKGNHPADGSYTIGLGNTDWNVDSPDYVSGRAATEDQLAKVSEAITNATTAAGKRTVVTVNDKSNPAIADPGTNTYGEYASNNGNLMVAAERDNDGLMTYNIKLNDQLTIGKNGTDGQDGKDGTDGKVTVETSKGTTVVIGHDGEPGQDGRDGLFVTGKDGKDGKSGVSITGPDGVAGKDGVDGKVGIAGKDGKDAVSISGKDGIGHIGLTGQKGADGKDGVFNDLSTILGTATLDPAKNEQSKSQDKVDADDKSSRIQYQTTVTDKDGKTKTVITHEVATMDDGQKYAGDFGNGASVKLNKTVTIKGKVKDGAKEDDFVDGNIAVVANKNGEDGELLIKLNKDLTGLNSATYKTSIKNGDVTTTSTTVVDGTGLKIENGPSITNTGIDGGKHQITNVASGKDGNMYDTTVKGQENWNNAANIGDVTNIAKSAAEGVQAKSGKNITVDDSNKVNLNDHITLGDTANKANQVDIDGNGAKITAGDGGNKVTVDGSKGQIVAGGDNGVKVGNIANGDSSLTIYDKDGKATDKKADGGKYVTNLDNKTWNEDGSYVSGRAATEDQLHQLESSFNTKVDAVEQNHTAVTVNGSVEAPDAGANGTLGNYTDEKKGNLLLAQKKDSTGKITYDLKLNDKVTLGKAGTNGKDGVDGSIGLTGADGKSSIGLNGKDGISVIGADGKNGVSITGSNGKDGKDGIDGKIAIGTPGKDGQPGKDAISISGQNGEGHIGLTGPAGKDGKDAAADIHVVNGQVGVDGTDGHGGKDGMDRVVYEDHNHITHEVATMDDGMKYSGDSGNAAVKLNNNVQIYGGAKEYADGNNIGVVASQDGDNAKLQVKLAKDLKGINSIESNSVTTGNTTINNGGLTIKTGDENRNITVQDGNVNMGGNQIHNVAPGQAPGDAVNVSQLNATNQTVANLGGAVNKLGTRVNRVGAGAAALAALHPLDFDPDDKWDFAAGYGNYKDASAVAVGAYYRPNEDTMFSVGGSFGGGENMVNAGVSFKVGQGNHVSTSRVAMAKEIKDLRQDVANLNAIVNRQSALIDKLTGTNAGTIQDAGNDLFPDVPANHWAYEYVTKLKQAGILTGYPDGNFDGDRMMTRYEFAAIVYRAIMAGAASNPALSQDGTLDKLAKEFSPEMKHIRIDTIAKDKNGKPTIERVRVIPEAQQ